MQYNSGTEQIIALFNTECIGHRGCSLCLFLFRQTNREFMEVIKMKEYQYLIGKVIVAMAIIVAAIIIAQAIGGAGESIRSGLLQLGDALR